MSNRISLLLVLSQSCLTKHLPFFFSTSKKQLWLIFSTPSSNPNLFASTFASNSNLDDQDFQAPLYPTSTITMSPIKFSKRKVRKVVLQLNTSKSSGPDDTPGIVLKPVPLNSPLFSTSFSNFPTFLVFSLPLGNSLTFSLSPKKVTNLTLQTITLLQSLLSSLRLWRPISPNNCLPSLKQTTFFLTINMGFDKPGLPVTF